MEGPSAGHELHGRVINLQVLYDRTGLLHSCILLQVPVTDQGSNRERVTLNVAAK